MSIGVICSYNKVVGIGVIKDTNKQKIKFFNQNTLIPFLPNDVVRYEVSQTSYGLMAIDVVAVIDNVGDLVKLHSSNKGHI